MQRYFVTAEQFEGTSAVRLTGEDAYHAVRVMRMKPGDKFIVSDGASVAAVASVRVADSALVQADVIELLPMDGEPRWSITIAQSLPKGDKMELVIQKGTEIGAYSFAPFESERMIVQYDRKKEAKRMERWSKIAKEAAEQSHRSRVPAVDPVRSWRELIAAIPAFDLALFCYEREGHSESGRGVKDAVQAWKAGAAEQAAESPRMLLIVGPEGGFTEREADEAEAAGAVIAGLGRRILRTETAGIVGLTCLLYESGEMGGA